jgi:flagellar motility protein MotE (MotC chaperone)
MLFIIVCIICTAALSTLSAIIALGRVPFGAAARPQPEIVQTGTNAPVEQVEFRGDRRSVDRLKAAAEKEKAEFEKRMKELTAREAAVSQQKELIVGMENRLKELQSKLDETIVEIGAQEQVNFKKLSEIFSKMDSGGAAKLLEQMEVERAAKILKTMADRQAAAVMDSAVNSSPKGAESAAKWADVIRRLKNEEKKGAK